MRKPAPHVSHDLSEESVLGDHLESITDALASWVLTVIKTPPPEPCFELNFWDISVTEWRRALDEWCCSAFVRRAYGYQTTEGLRMALVDFDDETVIAFLQSLI